MKKRKHRKIFYGIQRKIILFITLLLSILFLVTYLGINQVVKTNTYESLSEQYAYLNEKMVTAFEKIEESVDSLTADYILNDYVQKSLTNQTFTASDLEMMKRGLAFYSKSFLDYYLVIDNKGNLYSQRNVSLDMDTFPKSVLYKSLGQEYSRTKILWTRDVIFGTNEMSFFAVRYIHEMNSVHEPGILILKLNDSLLDGVRESIENDRLVYFILDRNQEVCFGRLPDGKAWDPDEESARNILWNEILAEGEKQKSLDQGILSSRYDENTGFTIITYAPKEVANEVVWKIQFVLASIFLVTYSLAVAGVVIFARRFTRPIKYISDTMGSFDESRLDYRIHLDTNTELDNIGLAYNNMVDEVKDLMEDVKKKERELRESEIHSLMYQIRPHFLYNTLDTIYMLARIQKEETIMRMIQSLSRFLRINLSNGKEEIEVKKELEHVSSYLEIQKIRNAELFTYEIEKEEAIEDWPVMKMILQPLAENCIKYGFQDIFEGGRIRIRAFREEGCLCFSVENNGEPISEEALEKLNCLEHISMEEIDGAIQKRQGGFGVCNVVKRLRMRYGDGTRFYYVRKESGTECVIKIAEDRIQSGREEKA
ncbi:MAG: histidine kinase [Eubacteriales bacterium]|nr:histidine kinase [Eubacteriales bacterium]